MRTSAAGGSVRRRIAIQLPPDVTANTAKTAKAVGRRGSSDQGGEPLLYGDETAICSGWVSYSPGLSGGRAQGTVMLSSPSSRKVGEVKDAELAGRWIERLAEETEEGVEAAMGVVRDVQAALLDGASKLLPLREVAGWVEGTAHREVAGKLLFQSACLAVDPSKPRASILFVRPHSLLTPHICLLIPPHSFITPCHSLLRPHHSLLPPHISHLTPYTSYIITPSSYLIDPSSLLILLSAFLRLHKANLPPRSL